MVDAHGAQAGKQDVTRADTSEELSAEDAIETTVEVSYGQREC